MNRLDGATTPEGKLRLQLKLAKLAQTILGLKGANVGQASRHGEGKDIYWLAQAWPLGTEHTASQFHQFLELLSDQETERILCCF